MEAAFILGGRQGGGIWGDSWRKEYERTEEGRIIVLLENTGRNAGSLAVWIVPPPEIGELYRLGIPERRFV